MLEPQRDRRALREDSQQEVRLYLTTLLDPNTANEHSTLEDLQHTSINRSEVQGPGCSHTSLCMSLLALTGGPRLGGRCTL